VHVKNPEPRPGEIDPFDSWEELDAIAAALDETQGPMVIVLAGTGLRPERRSAPSGATWTCKDG
jgi:hypothetical protein